MNKNILIASAFAAAASAVFYLIRRNMRASGNIPQKVLVKRSRHLTNAFSKAKQNVVLSSSVDNSHEEE